MTQVTTFRDAAQEAAAIGNNALADTLNKQADALEKTQAEAQKRASRSSAIEGSLGTLGDVVSGKRFGRQATERIMGRSDASAPNISAGGGGLNINIPMPDVGMMMARINKMAQGGADPREVMNTIKTASEQLVLALRPYLRTPGEGSQSDSELRQLQQSLGNIGDARTLEEGQRSFNELVKFAESITGEKFDIKPSGVKVPSAEEEQTWAESLFSKLFGGQ
jgi:hypothetical protein